MPFGIHRMNDITTGHSCWPPTQPDTWSDNVFVNGQNVIRFSDSIVPHCCGPVCHGGVYIGEMCNVFVNKQHIQLQTFQVDCGDFADTHSEDCKCCP